MLTINCGFNVWQHDKEATFPSLASVTVSKGMTLFDKLLFLNYLSDFQKLDIF
jgi:hypothetical protein